MTAAESLRRLLVPEEPVFVLPLHDGWERILLADPRLSARLAATGAKRRGGVDALRASGIKAVTFPMREDGALAVPILEKRVRGDRFGTLDPLVEERLAAGATATLGDPAILRLRTLEKVDGAEGYVVRYLLATPGTERRRGVEFLVAFPPLDETKLLPLEILYDGIIASGTWRVPAGG